MVVQVDMISRMGGSMNTQDLTKRDKTPSAESDEPLSSPKVTVDRVGSQVNAPVEVVWNVLTDYERLADFIPGLIENTVLSRSGDRVRLSQVAAEEIAFGASVKVKAVLDIRVPKYSLVGVASQDICFTLVESRELKEFTGTWHIQQGPTGSLTTQLAYVTQVRPQTVLPVGILIGRVKREVKDNLAAVSIQ
eukprot:gene7113-8486_t